MSDEMIVLSFCGYVVLFLLFFGLLCAMIKSWIREMFNRYNSHVIEDPSNTFEKFRLSQETKISIGVNYVLFALAAVVISLVAYKVVTSARNIDSEVKAMALKADADSLRYNYKLYKIRSKSNARPQLGNQKRVQKDGQARRNDNENKSRAGKDGIERGLL